MSIAIDTNVTHNFEIITKEIAEEMLLNNSKNRPITDATVRKYAKAMSDDNWNGYNGETIKFAPDGLLLDGQNRLAAVVECGKPQPFLVVRNVDEEARLTIDTGKARPAGSQVDIEFPELKNGNIIASSVRVFTTYQAGAFFTDVRYRKAISTIDIVNWVTDNYQDAAWVSRQARLTRTFPTGGVLGGMSIAMRRIDEKAAEEFLEKLSKGNDLASDDPILALRNRLAKIKAQKYKVEPRDIAYLIAVTWKRWYLEEFGRGLNFPSGGVTAKNFPNLLSMSKRESR